MFSWCVLGDDCVQHALLVIAAVVLSCGCCLDAVVRGGRDMAAAAVELMLCFCSRWLGIGVVGMASLCSVMCPIHCFVSCTALAGCGREVIACVRGFRGLGDVLCRSCTWGIISE
jgi:hypothetical protein